jgi:hypothetical protein
MRFTHAPIATNQRFQRTARTHTQHKHDKRSNLHYIYNRMKQRILGEHEQRESKSASVLGSFYLSNLLHDLLTTHTVIGATRLLVARA